MADSAPAPTALVIGASGMLGYGLCQHLVARGEHCVVGTWRSLPVTCEGAEMVHLDMSLDGVGHLIRERRPAIVYHLAWDTSIELCEKDPVRAFHPIEVGLFSLIDTLNEIGSKLVFISTDSVFGDASADRTETALPTPVNTYARSKILAEGLIRTMARHWVIARCCPVGAHPFRERGLVTWLVSRIRAQQPFSGWQDSLFTPLSVPTLSRLLGDCGQLDRRLIHLFAGPPISKYEFLRRLLIAVAGSDALIAPSTMDAARLAVARPHNQALQTAGGFPFANTAEIDEEIAIIADQIERSLAHGP